MRLKFAAWQPVLQLARITRVSRALADAAKRDGIELRDVTEFEALPGCGTKGMIDGKLYHLGNHRLIHEQGRCSDELEACL